MCGGPGLVRPRGPRDCVKRYSIVSDSGKRTGVCGTKLNICSSMCVHQALGWKGPGRIRGGCGGANLGFEESRAERSQTWVEWPHGVRWTLIGFENTHKGCPRKRQLCSPPSLLHLPGRRRLLGPRSSSSDQAPTRSFLESVLHFTP